MSELIEDLDDGKSYWRRNLLIVWLSQFTSMVGFAVSLPFAPFFLRELLLNSGQEAGAELDTMVKMCASLSASLSSFTLAVMAPVWGILSDKYGRKPMLLRANFGAAVVLFLMGHIANVESFLVLRFIQGIFAGTMTASMTLVSACTPRKRIGMALGFLSAGVYSGDMTGQFLGGVLADRYGYTMTFTLSALLLVVSGFLVLFCCKEEHIRVAKAPGTRYTGSFLSRFTYLLPCLPLYLGVFTIAVCRCFDSSLFALYVESLNGGPDMPGKEVWTGRVAGLASVGAMLSGIFIGRFLDSAKPRVVAWCAAIGAGAMMGSIGLVPSMFAGSERIVGDYSLFGVTFTENVAPAVLALLPLRTLMIFCSAGLDPIVNVWLSKSTTSEHRGIVFGCAVTCRSMGNVLGPLLGGIVSVTLGTRAIFLIGPWLFFLLVPLFWYISHHLTKSAKE